MYLSITVPSPLCAGELLTKTIISSNLGAVLSCDDPASLPKGVAVFLVTSCNRDRDKRLQCNLHDHAYLP